MEKEGTKVESLEKNNGSNGNYCQSSSVIILGSGSSDCTPEFACLIQPSDPPCKVCFDSLSLPPEQSPNYRCNTSLLIDYCPGCSDHSYIMIDVGKTFREQVLCWFTHYKILRLDSIILTHEHADAIHGLDDVRALQAYRNDIDPMPIYLNQFTMDSVVEKFRYLVPLNLKEVGIERPVSQIDWKIIDSCAEKPFIASGLKFVPLPVMHGEGYVNLGFLFGEKYRVFISSSFTGHLSRLTLQTLNTVGRICPKHALLVGMSHDFDYYEHNKILDEWSKEEGIPVQLTRDGLQIFTNDL